MTTRQRLFLTSWEKFVLYGVVPWKLILNVALLVLFTSHVIIMNVQESNYIQAAARSWYYWFYPAGYDFSDVVWYTYTVEDTVSAIQRAVGSYYSLRSGGSALGTPPDSYNYTWTQGPDGLQVPAPPTLTVESYSDISSLFTPGGGFDPSTVTATYTFTNATDLGPLTPGALPAPQLADFFRSMVSARLELPPISNFAFGSLYRNCMSWSLAVNYDFANRGQVQLTMDQAIVGSCDVYVDAPSATSWAVYGHKLLWLNFFIFGLAVVHVVLIVKATLRSYRLMQRLRKWAATQAAEIDATLSGAVAGSYRPPGSQDSEDEEGPAAAAAVPGATGPQRRKVTGGVSSRGLAASAVAAAGGSGLNTPGNTASMKLSLRAAFDAEGDGAVFISGDAGAGAVGAASGGSSRGLTGASASTPGSAGTPRGGFLISAAHPEGGAAPAGAGAGGKGGGDSEAAAMREPLLGGGGGGAAAAAAPAAGSVTPSHDDPHHHLGEGVLLLPGETEGAKAAAAQHYRETIAAAAELLHTKWEALPWRERFGFVNGWSLVALLADVLVMASCAWNLHIRTGVLPFDDTHSFVMASAVATLWVSVLRYFEHNRTYFNIVLTLRRAGPRVLRFLAGILPIFVAYALFAVVMFSDRIPRFCDLRTTFITLFANLNGDVVRETFMAIMAYHPVVGQFYFYTFISLHIYVVLNIIIAVVEESYFITVTKTEEMEERQHLEGPTATTAEKPSHSGGGSSSSNSSAAPHQHGAPSGTAAQPASGVAQQPSTQSSLASSLSGGGASSSAGAGGAAAAAAGVASAAVHPAAPLPRVLAALPEEIDPLHTPARLDSHGVKERPESKLTAILRLAEWAEVVTPGQPGQPPKR